MFVQAEDMISLAKFSARPIPGELRPGSLEAILILVGAIGVAACILAPKVGLLVLIGCATLWFVALVSDVFRGRFDGIMLLWAVAFPFGYTVLLFPRERAIVTLDRVVLLVALVGILLVKPDTFTEVPKPLRRTALIWLVFIVVAGVTLGKSVNALNAIRILSDGFLAPLLLAWCVLARFDVRRRLPTLHTAVCISSILCAGIAAAEIITRQDLLPDENSTIFFGGSIPRPNGPFPTNDALALVGAISLFFLLFLRAGLGPKLSSGRKMLHSIGLVATIGMALMPMFRSVAIALLLALIIDTFWERGTTLRGQRVVLMLAFAGLIFLPKIFAPDMFEDRMSASNVYGRVAQLQQSLRVFLDHPLLGVGFCNFHNVVGGESRYLAFYKGVSSLDSPHSNLAQVLTETGIFGFVPYVMAQVLLFIAMWGLRKLSYSGYLVWKYFIYVSLCYWIIGLDESTGYGPANLWYLFVIAVFCRYVLTDPDLMQSTEVQVSDLAFSMPSQVF
jgi:O-antigen ligase/polysaccharide polymerase Wzy-like membrane protein